MAPYEDLYKRKSHSSIHWIKDGYSIIEQADLMRETTKAVKKIQYRLKTLQSWQNSYADK